MQVERLGWAAVGLLAAVVLLAGRAALACGAMVFAEHEERAGGMSDQEVVLLLSESQSAMIVSAGWVDTPGDFAFLLPLGGAPTEVLDGDARLFYALEHGTAPRITVVDETQVVDSGGGGCGCGAGDAAGGGGAPSEDVVVVQRGQTSTYDFVVVGGGAGGSVGEWLADEGFAVPTDMMAAIDAYVADGWLFLAARVAPGASAGELAPLELRFPGMLPQSFVFPIGIAAYSLPPGDELSITLYVLSEETVLPDNYVTGSVLPSALRATSPTTSNYGPLFDAVLASDPDGVFAIEAKLQTSATALTDWTEQVAAEGLLPEDLPPADSDVADFQMLATQALGNSLRVTRYRTRLAADQLRDVTFMPAAWTDLSNRFTVYWTGTVEGGEDAGDVSLGALMALVVGVLVYRTRRRPA